MSPSTLDSPQTILDHARLIHTKPLLKHLYIDFYHTISTVSAPRGIAVELGSGGGFIKSIYPTFVTSDVVPGPGIDRVFAAESMPFRSSSVSLIYMLNVFHHIKHPKRALQEMQRVLKPRGKIIMLEPYNSSWGRWVYQHFHHETFDPSAGWAISGRGRMSDANGALPWIVFVRDRQLFDRQFPKLQVIRLQPHTPFLYLLSGGLSHPQYVPTFAYPLLRFLESLLPTWGMFVTIILEKTI